jgi:hypothetical protein
MISRNFLLFVAFIAALFFTGCSDFRKEPLYSSAKPYTRWWWFADVIQEKDIADQLNWVKANGFGGVEIAFVYPVNRNPLADRTPWLSETWTARVTYAKQYADKIGIGCDFTFGTLWPFGGTFVDKNDATQVYGDSTFWQPLFLSWTHPDTGNVLNHMSRDAFQRYASVMGDALRPALEGSPSALFCDSWEVETRRIWTDGFDQKFLQYYGYDIRPFMDSIYTQANSMERYDYMKLVADYVLNGFYIPFTETSHQLGAFARAQCAGSPTDLIDAYASVDIPETEAMLYEPNYSKIVASAAALAGKNIVSSESFTCLYGHPDVHLGRENMYDLKLVADALFANGVNQIVWHGMPYNPAGSDSIRFYASVHVGKAGALTPHFQSFNKYLTAVSSQMRTGRSYADVAVYLPLEDAWIEGEYPEEKQMKWSWGAYELRYVHLPEELEGYPAWWINRTFLERLSVVDGEAQNGTYSFQSLIVDARYLDVETLAAIYRLTNQGFPVVFLQTPIAAGKNKSNEFNTLLKKTFDLPTTHRNMNAIKTIEPLVRGSFIPAFWCRETPQGLILFFAHPAAKDLTLPVAYEMEGYRNPVTIPVTFQWKGKSIPFTLKFNKHSSLLIKLTNEGSVEEIQIPFELNK